MKPVSEQHLRLTSRIKRIVAFVVDHFVITFLIVSAAFLALGPGFMDEYNPEKMASALVGVMIPGLLLYFVKDSIKGISLGRWIMGIMVRDEENPDEVPSFGRLLLRNLLLIIWPVELIVLASNPEKKRLGDKIAKTIVVDNPAQPKKALLIVTLAGIAIMFFAFTFLIAGSAMKSSEAYKTAIKEIERNQEIISETGEIEGYGMFPTGSVSTSNGRGQALLEIKVIGKEKKLKVRVYLEKELDGKWVLKDWSK